MEHTYTKFGEWIEPCLLTQINWCSTDNMYDFRMYSGRDDGLTPIEFATNLDVNMMRKMGTRNQYLERRAWATHITEDQSRARRPYTRGAHTCDGTGHKNIISNSTTVKEQMVCVGDRREENSAASGGLALSAPPFPERPPQCARITHETEQVKIHDN